MSKNTQKISQNVEPISAPEYAEIESQAESSLKQDMPVEEKEKAHLKTLKHRDPVLLPGRCKPINEGLLGEFEMLVMTAEKEGNHASAADIHKVLSHLGALLIFARELKQKGKDDLLLLLSRSNELFM